jgi:hypothetical protein
LREHPHLNNKVSAAIRYGLASYHKLQVAQQEAHVRTSCKLFAHELESNYSKSAHIAHGWAKGDAGEFSAWLQAFAHQAPPGGFAEATVRGKSPAATSKLPDGKPSVHWFVVGDLVIGQGSDPADDWYVVPLAAREDMPAVIDYTSTL